MQDPTSQRTKMKMRTESTSLTPNWIHNWLLDLTQVPDMPAVKASSSRGSKGKSVRKRQTRTSGKMLAAWVSWSEIAG